LFLAYILRIEKPKAKSLTWVKPQALIGIEIERIKENKI